MSRHIVVIGGGISGLSAAYRLNKLRKQAGIALDITLVEKEKRLGGSIYTEYVNNIVIEAGPDCFFAEKPYTNMLIDELGISGSLIGTDSKNQGTFVLWKGKLHKLPEGVVLMIPTRFIPFVTSTLFSIPGKIRMGMELFVSKRTDGVDESLSEFTIRRFGKEAFERIAEPLVAGIHAGNPDTMSVRSSFPRFVDLEQKYGSLITGILKTRRAMSGYASAKPASMFMTMKRGLIEIIEALRQQSDAVNFKAGIQAEAIERNGKAYGIALSSGEYLNADGIIIALPSYAAAKLVSPMSEELAELLLSIPYVSTATISLAYKKDGFKPLLKGYGFVVPRKEKRHIMAATWTSSKFSYRSPDDVILIRCFIGGTANQEMVSKPDDEIIGMIKSDLMDIIGITQTPILTRLYRWHKSLPQYTIGHAIRLKTIEQLAAGLGNIQLCGSAYHGIGISDCINDGNTAAQNVLRK